MNHINTTQNNLTKTRILPKNRWPQSLLEIPQRDLPKKLRIIGKEPNWSNKRICIVGSRKFSDYGRAVCEKLINELSSCPITIVSGLAFGIDSISHRIALENNMDVIAVPGSGLNEKVLYPKTHIDLARKVLKSDGCLISEFDDNQPATIWTFPQRNRIMAGISDLVIIIEAVEKSGTMITARLALDYNIDVAVIPGSIFSENSKGTNKLMKEGAYPITCVEDVLEILNIKPNQEKIIENKTKKLPKKVLHIFNLLNTPQTKDQLLEKNNMDISDLNKVLTILEIEGLIHRIDDKICQK
jgi:DNA processing protein